MTEKAQDAEMCERHNHREGKGFKPLSPDRPVEATTLTMKAHFCKRLSGDNPAVRRFRSIKRRGPAGSRYIRETAGPRR